MPNIIPIETIENKIYLIRGLKVMLASDLAKLYGVKTKALNQAVKRNSRRFPSDFMFKLTAEEAKRIIQAKEPNSRSQIVTLNRGSNIKYLPYAFTEQGVSMLSSVLSSNNAIDVNIAIMRTFVKLRRFLSNNKDLAQKLKELERKYEKHDIEIQTVFEAIRELMMPKEKPTKKFGFQNG
ncbi:ORF6N domain-containing protein [Candidatus Saganbacteria bacterium]|nr:ORF6N domain-containing protein [Candidatus Saganbacteria bacterium]